MLLLDLGLYCSSRQPSVCPRGINIVWRTLSPNRITSWTITPLHVVLLLRCPLVLSHLLWLWRSPVFFFIASHLWKCFPAPGLLHLCHGVYLGMRGTSPHLHSLAVTCTL